MQKQKLLLATSNNSKIKPFLTAWENTKLGEYYDLLLPSDIDGWQDLDIAEDTGSCELDSLKKAKSYAEKYQMITVSLDRCFGLDALDGWPGTKAKEVLAGDEKRKLGVKGYGQADNKLEADIERSRGILKKIEGKDRGVELIYGIAVAFPDGRAASEEVRIHGTVSDELRVTNLGYFSDWFFIPQGETRTKSQFSYDELLKFQSEVEWPIPKTIEEFLINEQTLQH